MADLSHIHGGDLAISITGGLTLASGTEYGQQRVIRRLMTNPGDDQWTPEYGGGAPSFVGSTASADRIRATFLKQLRLEAVVDQSTAPQVTVSQDRATGTTMAAVSYRDALTGVESRATIPMGNANGS